MKTIVLIILGLSLVGCSDPTYEPPCPASVAPAIVVRVVDSATQELLSGSASGVVSTGSFTDSLEACGLGSHGEVFVLCAAQGLSGVFAVSVGVPTHAPWDTTGVVVPRGRCGNGTAYLVVPLDRLASRPGSAPARER